MIAEFVLTLYKRSPYVRSSYSDPNTVRESLNESLADLKRLGYEPSKDLISLVYSEYWLSKAAKQATVKATLLHSKSLIEWTMRKGLQFACPQNSQKSFILGSKPFLQLRGYESEGLRDPRSEFWLPLGPRVALLLFGAADINRILELSDGQMRFLNRLIWD